MRKKIDRLFQLLTINQRMIINMLVTLAGMLGMLALVFSQSSDLNELSTKARLAEKLNSGMLTLRRNEKDFLARLDLKYVEKFSNNYQALLKNLAQYQLLEQDNADIETFARHIGSYNEKFAQLIEVQKTIGLNPKDGHYGALRAAVHQIEDVVKAQNDYRLLSITLQLRRREKDFMLRLDPKYVDKFEQDLKLFNDALTQSAINADTKRAISSNLDNYQEKFYALVAGMKALGLTPTTGKLGELRHSVHQTESILDKLVAANQSEIDSTITATRTFAMIFAVVLATLVCAFIFFSSSSILHPILKVSRRIGQIRNNDDLTIRVRPHGRDEIAELVVHFNSLVDDFQQLVGDVDGTLTTLNGAVKGLRKTADVTQHEIDHQLHETDMVAAAVTQMRATIDEIAKNTEQAAGKSTIANDNASEGYREVMQTADSITALSEQLTQAGNVVVELEQDAKNIGSVLDVIRNIAEQTNLLALNAAIEAARAGEQGRGFAVVADEVRNLAMRTQDSTREIENIIQTLQSRTVNVVDLMQQCRSQGDNSSMQAKKTGDLLLQITHDVTQISDMSAQIATAIEQQSKVASEVNENVVRIRDIADQSNQNALSIVEVSHGVAKQSGILVKAVHKFKV